MKPNRNRIAERRPMSRKWARSGAISLMVAAMSVGVTPLAQAATYIRQDNSTTLNLVGAWSGGPPDSGNTAQWDATCATPANCSVNMGNNLDWAGIIVISPGADVTIPSAGSFQLNFETGGISMTGTRGLTINCPVHCTDSGESWNNSSSAGTLTVAGTVAQGNQAALTITGSGNTIITGNMSGSGYMIKSGAGTLTLSGDNGNLGGGSGPYGLRISAGTVNINSVTAIGGNNCYFNIDGTATIDNTSSGDITLSSKTYPQNWNADFTFTGTHNLNMGTGNVSLGSDRTVTVTANTLTVGGVISGGSKLTKAGNGTLTLTGNNSFSGVFTINAGVVSVSTIADANNACGIGGQNLGEAGLVLGGGTLQYTGGTAAPNSRGATLTAATTSTIEITTAGTTLTFNKGAGSGNLVKAGPGTLYFSYASLTIGTLTVNGGTVKTSGNTVGFGATTLSATGTSSTVTFDASPCGGQTTLSSLTLGGSTTSSASAVLGCNPLLLTGSITYDASNNPLGATISNQKIDLNGSTCTMTIGDSSSTSYEVTISAAIQNGGITKTGAGTLNLSGVNTYTGATTINGGVLDVTGSLNSSSAVAIGGASASSTPTLAGNGTVSGTVAVNAAGGGAAGHIAPGDLTFGKLTIGNNLTLNNTVYLDYNLDAPNLAWGAGNNDYIDNTGGTLTIYPNLTLTVTAGGSIGAGKYHLIHYTALTDSSSSFSGWTVTCAGYSGTFSIDSGSKYIDVTLAAATANATWNVDNAGNWSVAGNWTPGVPGGAGTTANLTYNITAARTVTIDATSRTVGILNMGDPTATCYSYTLAASGGGTLTFDNSGSNGQMIETSTSAGETISAPLLLAGSLDITNGCANALTISTGGITASSGTRAISNKGTGNGAVVISGVIGNGGGTVTITQNSGTSALTLSGANTYSGGTTNASGCTLNINNATALGAVGGTFTIAGGTIDSSAADVAMTANNPQSWNGDFTFTGSYNLNLGTGTVTLGASRQVTVSAKTLTAGGGISGNTFNITKAGNGTLVLNGAIATTSGNITVSAGTLTLGGGNSFTGGVSLNAGTLNINNATALGTVAGTFTIAAGTTINSSAADVAMTANNPQSWNGDFTFTGSYNLNLGTGAATLSAARQVTVSANTLTVGGGISGAGFTITKAGNGTLVLNGAITTTSGGITVSAGTLTLAGGNNFTGGVTLNAGTLNINNATALGAVGGTFTIAGGTIDSSAADIAMTANNPQSWNGDFAFTGSYNLNLGTGAVTMNAGRQVTVNAKTLTVGGAIGGGAYTLTKAGTGTLVLAGTTANTYSGTTTVNAGELDLNKTATVNAIAAGLVIGDGGGGANADIVKLLAANQIADASAVTINSSGKFDMNNNSETIASFADTGAGGGNINLGSGTLTFGDATASLTFSGVIAGSGGALTKQGSGTEVLSGTSANTYSGLTTVSTGELDLGKTAGAINAIAGGGLTVGSASATVATVKYTGNSTDMMGAGAVSILGKGQLDFNGVSDIIGNVSIDATGAGGATTPIANSTAGGTLTIGTLGIKPVAGSTSTINLNSGTLTLGGDVTFTAATTGEAQINGTVALGNNRTFNIGAGTSGSYDLDINGIISGAFTVTVNTSGAGVLQFTGTTANTYGGLTTVSAGTLWLNKNTGAINAIAGGGLTIGSASATAALVKYKGNSTDMMGTGAVTLLGRGQLDFNGVTDTIGNVTITATSAGASTTPIINTAGNGGLTIGTLGITPATGYTSQINTSTGTLTLGGTVTFTAATSGQAQISGKLDVGTATRTIDVAAGSGAGYDMLIDAVISSGAGAYGITKTSAGLLRLNAADTYTGTTTVSAGTLDIYTAGTINTSTNITVAGGARLTVENAGNVIGDTATVALSSSGSYATMYLTNSVNDTVGYLYFDGDPQLSGTWGATGSGCANTNDNFFLGAGKLTVANGPAANNGSWGVDNGGNWSTPGNWRNSIIAFGAGNTAYFTNTVTVSRTVTNNYQTVTIDSMSFGSPGAFNWTVVGNTISMNGTVTVSANAAAINSILGGAGALAKAGAGTLTLAGTNTLTGGVTLNAGTLNINNATALGTVAGTFTIGGVTTIDSSAADVAMTANNPQAWNADFTFTGSYNLDMGTGSVTLGASRQVTASAKKLTVGGAISGAGLTITKAGNGTLALNGNITTTTGAITVSAGTLTLAGGNNFTGGVTLNAGTLNINNATALGAVGGTFTIAGGTIDSSAADIAMTANNPQSWNGDFAFTGSYNLNLGTGAVTMNAGRQVTVNAKTLTVGGNIGGGALALTKLGTGTLVLSGTGANTYSGLTTVSAGELDLGKTAGAINAIAGGGLTVGSASATVATVKYTGNSTDMMGAGAVSILGKGQLDFNGLSDTIGNVSIDATGAGAATTPIANTAGGTPTFTIGTLGITPLAAYLSTLSLNGGTLSLGGTVTFTAATTGQALISGNVNLGGGARTISVALGTGANYDLDINGVISNGTPTMSGTGRVRFTGATANTYVGLTTVSAGTLLLNKSGAVQAVAGGGLTVGSVSATVATAQYVAGGSSDMMGAGAVSILGKGQLDFNGVSDTIGNVSIDATGAGGVTTPIANTAGGTPTFTIGTLGITPLAGNLSTLSLNGGTLTLGGTLTFTAATTGLALISGNVNLGGGARTLSVALGTGANYDLDINGVISNGTPTMSGTGRLRFSGATANTYAGLTTVSAGTLLLNKSGAVQAIAGGGLTVGSASATVATAQYVAGGSTDMMGAGAVSILGKGQLDFNGLNDTIGSVAIDATGAGGVTTPIANTAGGTPTFTIGTLGITPLAGNLSTLNLNGGTLSLGGTVTFTAATTGQALISGNVNLGGGAQTISVALGTGANYDLDINGVISNGTPTMSGTGRLRFSGATANTYAGLTMVSAGTLLLNKSGAVQAIAGGGLTVGSASATAALVQYVAGGSTDMMGTGAVTLLGRGQLDFNGVTDTIGNVTITATSAGASTTPIINTAGNGILTIGTLGITPATGYTSQINTSTGTLTLGGTVTFTAATSGQAQISGKLDVGTATRTIDVAAGSGAGYDMLIDAVISSGAGAYGITKTSAGLLRLNAADTYTGTTTVSAGTLDIYTAGTINSSTNITVAGGARLTVENAGNVIGDTATVALSSSGSYATMYLTNSVNDTVGYLYFDGEPQLSGTWGATGSGCANTNDNFFLGAGKLTVANGPTANNGSWGVDNGGNWSTPGNWRNSIIAFGAGNTAYFTNTVTVSRTVTNNYQTVTIGSMSFGSPGAFNWTVVGNTISMNGTVTVSANAAAINSILGGAGALAKAGAGTLTLAGTNTLTGGVTLNAGTLNINNATALGTVAGTFTIGGVTTIDSSAADVAMTANNPQAWNADFTFTGSYNLDMGTGSVTLGASRQVTASAKKLTVGGAISGAGLTITKAGNGTLALNGNITTTTGAITVSAGTLTLAGANTFTGGVTNNASCTVNINSASALGGATSTFMILGGTIDSSVADVAMTANNPQSWNGDFTFTGNYNLNLGTGAVTMNAGRQVTVSAKTLTVGGAIGGGAYTLTKLGTGTLVLAGTAANTYSGTTTVNYGELDLNKTAGVNAIAAGLVIGDGTGGANADIVKLLASNQIADTSAVTINSSGKFDMNNNSETIASFADAGAGVGNINLGSGTLTFGDATASLTFSGVIAGSGAVTKQGSGTMILSGANTYNGATAVNCGTLTLNGINTGATTITVGGNGTTGTPTLTGTGTAGGAVTISGPGTGVAGTISSSNGSTLTISGVLTLSSGSLSSFSLSGASTATPEIDASAGGISSSAACNTITFTGTPTSGQQYNLFKYKAGGDPGTTAFSINTGASPSGFSYTLYDDTVNHYIYVIPNILPKYWDTNGATTGCGNAGGTWDTGTTANWCSQADGAAASGMWVAGCDAVFSAGTDGTGSLTISGSGVNSVRNLTVEEGTISLSTGTGSFTLAAGATWNVSAGNSLTVGRNIDNGGNLFTVTNALSATLTFNCGISGAGGLTKNGSGTVSLGGQINSYGGTTTVNAGTLQVGINGQNFGAVVVGGVGAGVTATFDLNSHDANVSSLTLGGSTTTSGASVTMPGTGGIHFSGDITYDATHNPLGATITPGGGSKLSMNATRTLTIGDSSSTPDDLTISAPIDNTGGITKAGAGTLTLSAQNNFTTVVTINAGTVKLGIDGQDTGHSPLGTAGASVTATGAALDVNGTSAVNLPVTLNGTGVSSCGALMNSSITLGTYAGLITLGSASSIDAWNGDLNVNNGGTITGSGFGLTLDGVGTSTSSSLASIIGTGAGTLTKNGAGTWTISVNNSYTGVTTISGGTLIVNNFANGGAVSGIGASTAAAANLVLDGGTLKFAASGYATSDRAFTITANGGAIDASGPGGTLSLNGTTDLAASGTGNRTLTLTGNNVDFNDLIPKIVDPSSGSTCLAKSGVGKWRLSNTTANTFTGSTTVNAGTLYLDYNSAALNKQKIATGAALILGGGTLYLNDYNAGTTATLGNGLQLNAGGSTITLAGLNGGSSFALSGITRSTAGTLNYSKLASGNITTTKVNSNGIIGGYFVVNNNDWAVGSDSGSASNVTALATYTVLPASGASSTVNYQSLGSGNTITLTASETGNSLQIVSQSRVTVNSPYTLTLTSGGIIMVGGDQQNIDGTGIVGPPSGTGELFVWATGPGNYGISCRIIGDGTSGSLVKDGPNTLGLGFANNYTGGTFINNGALMQNVANAVPTNSLITANGMYNLGTYNATINGLCGSGTVNHGAASVTLTICGTGQNNTFNGRILENGFPYFLTLVMTGTGTQTLGGVNGYTSSTTINGGTLNITGSLASGSAVTVGGASASGTPTLAGNGWIYGSTTVNSSGGGAAGHIAPGNAGAGRLSTASLTLNPTVNLEFDLDQPNLPFGAGTNDYIVVTNGGSANLTISTNLTFTITGGPSVGSGKYHLIKYNGTLTDNSSGFTAWTIAPPSYSGTFSSDTVNKYIDLTLSFSAPYGPTISNDGGPSNVTSTAAWLIASLTSTGNAPTTVYVFWDTADQGTNQTAWAFTNSYGVLATGVYSNNATSLITDTPYYYRSYATNSAGQCWATATTFTPRLLPPTINNDGGASNIAGSAATLNGNLTSTGGAPTTVYIFWGSSDGGTTMANWGHTNSLGSKGTGFLSSDISGLAGSTTYYYRFYATNSAGQCWASPSSSFTTPWNGSGFGNKLKITFSGYNKTDTLTNFPALVVLSTNITNFSYIEFGSTNGWDLTFQNSNETVLLNYEIEKWDPSTISSPTDIPGCQLWLRADQGVLTNTSGVVTNWQDQSGRGVVLTNSGSPAVITNLYNGQPAVRFYGTNDWFSDVNLGSSNNYFHSFCVLKAKSGSTSTFLYALHSSTLYAAKLWVNGSSKYEIGYHTGYYVQSDNAVGNLDLVQSSYGGNTLLQYVNGEQQSGSFSSGDSDTTYGGAYTMFNEYNGVSTGYLAFAGDVAEMIVYSNTLSAAQQSWIGGYLAKKYGLSTSYGSYPGQSYVWAQVPSFYSNCWIWAYWSNASYSVTSAPAAYTTNGATWDSNFGGVWHMSEAAGHNGTQRDSTSNNNTMTLLDNSGVSTGGISSVVDGGDYIYGQSGDGRRLQVDASASIRNSTNLTVSMWTKHVQSTWWSAGTVLMTKRGEYEMYAVNAHDVAFRFWSGGFQKSTDNYTVPDIAGWHYYVGTYSKNSQWEVLFFDGQQVVSNSYNFTIDSGNEIAWGYAMPLGPSQYRGWFDESRFEPIARGSNWIWACYMTMASNTPVFTTYGTVQFLSVTNAPIIDNDSGPSNVTSSTAWLIANLISTGSVPTTVRTYWDTTDRGENLTAWAYTNNTFGQVPVGVYSNQAASLTTNTTYYYRSYATNSAGQCWAGATSFTTWGPPTITYDGGASNVSSTFAWLNANLLGTGGVPTTVRIFWDTASDKGTSQTAWAYTNDFGVLPVGLCSNQASGLSASTLYYYRAYATNSVGQSWSDVTNFTTLSPNATGWLIEIE